MDGTMATAGILLAAGYGRRFGPGNKLLADWHGTPVVLRAAAALRASGVATLVAVVRDRRVVSLLPDFRIVPADAGGTMADSLRLGLAAVAGAEKALMVLGDMPAVPPGHLAALVRVCTADRPAASLHPDGHPGVPACLPRAMFAAAAGLEGDAGARGLLADATTIPLPPDADHDIDCPEDLRR